MVPDQHPQHQHPSHRRHIKGILCVMLLKMLIQDDWLGMLMMMRLDVRLTNLAQEP